MDYLLKINSLQNPNRVPLNELNLEYKSLKKTRKIDKNDDISDGDLVKRNYDVRIEKIPALDRRWLEINHPFHLYQPYFPEVSAKENETFFDKNKQYLDGIEFLLSCSYQQFWCYLTCDSVITKVIKSYIFNALPWYDVKNLDKDAFQLFSNIHDKMLLLFCKLFTYKESETEFMSESTILNLLERVNLLNFPIIMRLCLLYKNTDTQFVKKVLDAFSRRNRSAFKGYCKKVIEQAITVFEMIGGYICGFDHSAVIIPLSIGPKPNNFDPYWYADAMLLLTDTICNLNAFLGTTQDQICIAFELELPKSLTFFYNQVFPRLYKILSNPRGVNFDWSNIEKRILDNIAVSRSEFVNCYDGFVEKTIENIIQTENHQKQDEYLENYISLISSAMDEEYFIIDYHNAKNIDVQLQYICDFYPQHDKMRIDYLTQCLNNVPNLKALPSIKTNSPNSQPCTSFTKQSEEQKQIKVPEKPLEEEIECKISMIQDTFPDYGDGYILKCLESYNYNPESVISAILDNNLPPHIQMEPIGLIRIPPEPEPEQPILAYRGKKPMSKVTKDKTDMQKVKNYILRNNSNSYDIYDDEYDDREDYEAPRRPTDEKDDPYKYMENRFDGYDLVSDPSQSSSEDEATQKTSGGKDKKNFCEDPALMRQQREMKFSNNKDVVGKPKGQGQNKSVLKNRQNKEVNKSSKANHNRKSGAQWKRNKGMFPS